MRDRLQQLFAQLVQRIEQPQLVRPCPENPCQN